MTRARGICLLLCLCLALAGCSRTAFVYNRLDFLLPWYIQGYADLSGEQEDYLDQLLVPFLGWHRSQELPCYVVLLEDVEAALESRTLDGEDIGVILREFESAWLRIEARGLEHLLDLGAQLSDAQVADLLAELEERHQELAEEYLPRSDDEFFQDSYDAMLDTAEEYLGRLQQPQRGLLQAGSRELKRADGVWLARRAAHLRRLAILLEREPGWQQGVRELIATRDESVSREYSEKLAFNIRLLQELTARVLNVRTERQDAHLRKRLASYREDFTLLAAQAEGGAAGECAGPPKPAIADAHAVTREST